MIIPEQVAKILIVEDSETNIMIMKTVLQKENYNVFVAKDGEEALKKINEISPDLILLDLQLPKIDGYEITKRLKSDEILRMIPIVIVTGMNLMEDKIKGIELGADDYLMKPFNRVELLARVRSLIKMKRMNDNLESSETVLFTLAKTIEAKDKYTEGHSERVSIYATRLAKKIGMNKEELDIMRRGGLLHDIGKIGIPESILCKPGLLTDEEFEIMKTHPTIGSKITAPLKNSQALINMIRHHHEEYNGLGHPDGLKGKEIPLEARIVSIADTYDAITTTRPYRKASPKKIALNVLKSGKGTQWDENLVNSFIEMISDWENEKKEKRLKKRVKKNEAK